MLPLERDQKIKHETHHAKLTKTHVDKLTAPDEGQAFPRDTELKGCAVRITAAGAKYLNREGTSTGLDSVSHPQIKRVARTIVT